MRIVKDSVKNAVRVRNTLEIPHVTELPTAGTIGSLVFFNGAVQYWSEPDQAWIETGGNILPPPQVFLSPLGGGQSLVVNGTGPLLTVRSLKAGTGIGVGLDLITPGQVQISAVATTPATVVSSGTGSSLVSDGTGPIIVLKTLVAGPNVTLTSTATDITVSMPATGSPTIASIPAGPDTDTSSDLVSIGSGPVLYLKNLRGSSYVVIVQDPSPGIITIQILPPNIPTDFTLSSVGTGTSVIADPSPLSMTLKSIKGGGFLVANFISNTIAIGAVVNTDGSGGAIDLFSDASADPNFRVKTLSFPNTTVTNTAPSAISVYVSGSTLLGGRTPIGLSRLNWAADYFGQNSSEIGVTAQFLGPIVLVTVSKLSTGFPPFVFRAFECTMLTVNNPNVGFPVPSPVVFYFPDNQDDEFPTAFFALIQPTSVGGGNGSNIFATSPLFTSGQSVGTVNIISSDRSLIDGSNTGTVNPRMWEVNFDRSCRVSMKF